MTTNIEAWVIYAESASAQPRETDSSLFPWAWGEAIAVLPGDATPAERAAALAVVSQTTHYVDANREDILQFSDRGSYLFGLASQDYLDANHPYLTIAPAKSIKYVEAKPGESRGHIAFEVIPAAEL